ncbi:hypothetical protein JRO89_XS06G0020200 [Xanthoceras sorbifolium]|uniref:Uncharacterized protein n=1 Tax=Xanthoceras sorbifolium TaxID=99658 RepID=A0ABQ8HW49_9ROSI|nr:hypothetical protein JRO89_XS06G0020200 [Xanthoceras sorbifolium]
MDAYCCSPQLLKIVWKTEEDLDAGDVVVINLMNKKLLLSTSYGCILLLSPALPSSPQLIVLAGKRSFVLSTSGWLGGKNDFLGAALRYGSGGALSLA